MLNNRLFPVPIHGQEEAGSYCPVCEHKDDHDVMPVSYIRLQDIVITGYDLTFNVNRVSVPRSTTQPVYKLRPHRRKSFDPDDSLSLSKVSMICHPMCMS